MEKKDFKLWNRIIAGLMLLISAVVYLLTIEPTASFWDCGEFIASSYKLEVGHPPGNPVFQLFARLFSMFTGPENAALAVNAFSAICSAFTIFFLYLTIVFLAKRLIKPAEDGCYSLGKAIAIFGSGAVGALVYTFTDTFWFSAVEGEVYAMSSLVTALVFWAMTKWYDQADQPHSARWIVLISFLMGLSIGIHLLNLLAIPALVFLFFYKKRENGHYSFGEYVKIFCVSVVILAVILFGVIPYLPRLAAYFDLFFVNTLGLPFNSGAAFFMLALLVLCFWGIYRTMKKGKVLMNTILLSFTMIVVGFSLFSIVIIRSNAKTPTNEYQPDNPFTLIRYLGREQYGSNPLIYGQYFDSDYELEDTEYWAPMGDKYIKTAGQVDVIYPSEDKMLFPRMWSSGSSSHKDFYMSYMEGGDSNINASGRCRKPTVGENLDFFFDYQMNWMYWRYFMWNFAGRQNDIHGQAPGDQFVGNWECGIPFIDEVRLGDQSEAPDYLKNNKGKNHYYMLPLLLGIIGIFFQFARDKRGSWVTFLMFFMTGIAIVVYLNQPPYQVRERDYAYAGSFYSFSIWIGLAVAAIYTGIQEVMKGRKSVVTASVTTVALLGVPTLMAVENWDDHDRSNRYTAVEMAKNYLNSVGPNGILVTHGDNDTFPLWYAQEVEGIRTDVRIANTSLLGTDWHIDQMKWASNKSAPLDLSLGQDKYLYGTNEMLYVLQTGKDTIHINDLAAHLAKDTRLYQVELVDPHSGQGWTEYMAFPKGDKVLAECQRNPAKFGISEIKDMGLYIPAHSFILPVNKENILKHGILSEKYADRIPEQIILTIPQEKQYITKPELFMLDFLCNYKWDRPLNLLSMGGDINIGLKEYLMYEGFSYKFVPFKNRMKSDEIGFSDPDDLYYKMKNVYSWDALKRIDYFVDYQNYYTFCGVLSQRLLFLNVARELQEDGQIDKAVEILDMCQECVPEETYPLDIYYLGFSNEYVILEMIMTYFSLEQPEKAMDLAKRYMSSLLETRDFFSRFSADYSQDAADKLDNYRYYFTIQCLPYIEEMDPQTQQELAIECLDFCSELSADGPGDPEINSTLNSLYSKFGQKDRAMKSSAENCKTYLEEMNHLILEMETLSSDYYSYVEEFSKLNSEYDRLEVEAERNQDKATYQRRLSEISQRLSEISESPVVLQFQEKYESFESLASCANALINELDSDVTYSEIAKEYDATLSSLIEAMSKI